MYRYAYQMLCEVAEAAENLLTYMLANENSDDTEFISAIHDLERMAETANYWFGKVAFWDLNKALMLPLPLYLWSAISVFRLKPVDYRNRIEEIIDKIRSVLEIIGNERRASND